MNSEIENQALQRYRRMAWITIAAPDSAHSPAGGVIAVWSSVFDLDGLSPRAGYREREKRLARAQYQLRDYFK